ncbi:bacterio-opsin activator domain-containing protein [Haladaptatus sp. DYF46]|uniref:bacterio-opsin activator domain-containing protein n=1 Tax=Haladaptatus sp. DYF46 TaxID=2886041 RepID=UPI001E352D21|nr:bacterio-opsin activator domain-containing protein [Haladaptatus sp. DYF46]
MIEAVRVLFVPPPNDEGVITTLREQSNVLVETATTPVRSEILEMSDCVVCTVEGIDADVVTLFEDVQQSCPSLPRLVISNTVDRVVQDVLDRNLAEWIPTVEGERVLSQRINRLGSQRRRNERLSAVQDSMKRLTDAETEDRIAETIVAAVHTDLDYSSAIVARYDSEEGALRSVAWEGVAEPDERLFDADGGLGWKAFLDAEKRTSKGNGDNKVTRHTAFPLGRHGVLIVIDEENEIETEDADRRETLVEMLVSNAETAFARLDREWELSTQEAALSETETALEHTHRRETVLQDVFGALAEADTRGDIEHAVCKRLTNAAPYQFAWIGEYDATTDQLSGRTWVGDEQAFLDELSETSDETDQTTAWRSVRKRETTIDDDLLGDPPYEAWRQEALKRGYRAAVSVPLIYGGSIYGVLTVYAGDPDVFNDDEQALLESIGRGTAYAINAVESKKALVSDSAVELEFQVRDPQFTLIKFVETADCRFEFESVIRETDDTLRLFFTTEGTTPESVAAFSDQSLVVNDIRHVTGDDEKDLFECTMTGANVISLLLDHGAVPKAATAEGSEARLTVELPQTADVRRFVETFQNRYSNTELIARRKRNRPVQTEQDFRAQLRHRLTDRQSEALETAYWSGFFEWPRESTGQEIAKSLDVSQPTFNRHLRASERNLLTALFEDR